MNVPAEIVHVPDVPAALDDLARRGVKRILCEGGPKLNAELLQADLVDEIYFTLAPKLAGGSDPLTIVQGGSFPVVRLKLLSMEEHDGELFLRYGIDRSG